eukprot:5255785-Lingulodinium_polyedra.AAC.1
MMSSNIKYHLGSVSQALQKICGDGGTDNLSITYKQAVDECWADDGEIQKDWVAKLVKLNLCAEITQIDEVFGVTKILAA